MATRTARATFEVTSFAWASGTFTLTGTWSGAEGLGPVHLLVTLDGRRETLGAQGDRVAEDGPKWGARFRSDSPPDEGTPVALLLAGTEIPLPAPVVRGRFARANPVLTPPAPPAPPARGRAATPENSAEADEIRRLIAELREERRAAETALQRLQQERDRPAPAPARRPLPSRRPTEHEDVDYTPAYWVGAFALLLFLIVLIWIF